MWYQAYFIVNIETGTVRDNVADCHLLPGRLLPRQYFNFLETVLLALLEDVPLAVRQRFGFQHNGAPAHYR
jgi:hypothetical protein